MPGCKYYQKCCVLGIENYCPRTVTKFMYTIYHEARTKCLTEWSLHCHQCHLSITYHLKDALYMTSALDSKLKGSGQHICRTHPELIPNEVSKDISLLPIQTYDMETKTVVHHSDTVSVIVSCSMKPVVVDHEGLIRLSNILTSVKRDCWH